MSQSNKIPPHFVLKLYVTGASPNSVKAINNLKRICELHIKDKYQLDIIDVYQQPLLAKAEQVVALPMLVKSAPLPLKKLIGNMSDTQKILKGLDIE